MRNKNEYTQNSHIRVVKLLPWIKVPALKPDKPDPQGLCGEQDLCRPLTLIGTPQLMNIHNKQVS